jgi:hypothetical protein
VTADQVSGFFSAGEGFVEGTIAAALVILWILSVALHLARPYMVRTTGKFTLRLGADLWWIIYVALRDILLLQVFLGSLIFLYPDVMTARDMPVTGGLAAVIAFAVLLMKLTGKGDSDVRLMRLQVVLIGLGALLYIVPYMFGPQMTLLQGNLSSQAAKLLTSSQNPDLALPLCYLSAVLIGVMGFGAVAYNFRLSMNRRPKAA